MRSIAQALSKTAFFLIASRKSFKYRQPGELPNLLLSGTAGVGKTTIAKALCEEIGASYIVINGSDEGRPDTVKTV